MLAANEDENQKLRELLGEVEEDIIHSTSNSQKDLWEFYITERVQNAPKVEKGEPGGQGKYYINVKKCHSVPKLVYISLKVYQKHGIKVLSYIDV